MEMPARENVYRPVPTPGLSMRRLDNSAGLARFYQATISRGQAHYDATSRTKTRRVRVELSRDQSSLASNELRRRNPPRLRRPPAETFGIHVHRQCCNRLSRRNRIASAIRPQKTASGRACWLSLQLHALMPDDTSAPDDDYADCESPPMFVVCIAPPVPFCKDSSGCDRGIRLALLSAALRLGTERGMWTRESSRQSGRNMLAVEVTATLRLQSGDSPGASSGVAAKGEEAPINNARLRAPLAALSLLISAVPLNMAAAQQPRPQQAQRQAQQPQAQKQQRPNILLLGRRYRLGKRQCLRHRRHGLYHAEYR